MKLDVWIYAWRWHGYIDVRMLTLCASSILLSLPVLSTCGMFSSSSSSLLLWFCVFLFFTKILVDIHKRCVFYFLYSHHPPLSSLPINLQLLFLFYFSSKKSHPRPMASLQFNLKVTKNKDTQIHNFQNKKLSNSFWDFILFNLNHLFLYLSPSCSFPRREKSTISMSYFRKNDEVCIK